MNEKYDTGIKILNIDADGLGYEHPTLLCDQIARNTASRPMTSSVRWITLGLPGGR